ncbi:hypothetical protein Tco_1385091 [Tanacetum coccineum]
MNTTQAQQKALDDALVAPANRLEFGKCNMRLKTDIKLKEATFQVVLDALALTPFYQAFLITADVPTIYIHEDTQVYGTILPKELTNQAMLESNAYKTYYTFVSREKTPKPNEDEDDRNDSDDLSVEGDDNNDGGDDDANDEDKQEGDETKHDEELIVIELSRTE